MKEQGLDSEKTFKFVKEFWEKQGGVIDKIKEYIKIENQSPDFDPDWEKNGLLDKAVDLLSTWSKEQSVPNLSIEVIKEKSRTPLIFFSLPARACSSEDEVFLYGHCDKQPPLNGHWEEGLGPYTPVIKDGKLYGRGGADDGYSTFTMISLMKFLEEEKIAHPRITGIVEACEESGSPDLEFYVDKLIKDKKVGNIGLIICLDSGCGNYSQFWLTSSLRGVLGGTLTVSVLKEGIHSGVGSGVVPSSFRIGREILSRLEDSKTGKIIPNGFYVDIPEERIAQAKSAGEFLGDAIVDSYPWLDDGKRKIPVTQDTGELLLNRTWRPQLEITGADGLPPSKTAGNVLRPFTAFKVSLRIPPTLNAPKAVKELKELLEKEPPYNAKVTFEHQEPATGWEAPSLAPWLKDSLSKATGLFYGGKDFAQLGEGGSIPFMAMLGRSFPKAQFVVTGVLGPSSNAHAPNEFLHIEMAEKVTCVVTHAVADYGTVLNESSKK